MDRQISPNDCSNPSAYALQWGLISHLLNFDFVQKIYTD